MDGLLIALLMGLGITLPIVAVYIAYKNKVENDRLVKVPVRVDEEYPNRRY